MAMKTVYNSALGALLLLATLAACGQSAGKSQQEASGTAEQADTDEPSDEGFENAMKAAEEKADAEAVEAEGQAEEEDGAGEEGER
jgi:predicted small lipoprotein YifL